MPERVIDALAGEGLVVNDPQVSRILNRYDMTFGHAIFKNIIAIQQEANLTTETWITIHKILALFGIRITLDDNEENKLLNYLHKLQQELAKRFPSLLELYNSLLIDLYVNVKYLRNKQGFERINQTTKREEIRHIGEESEKAEETRESLIKQKLRGII